MTKRYTNKQQRQTTASKYGFSVPDYDPFSGQSEVDYYQRLARRADARLRKLEKISMEDREHFKGILKYAYANAMEDIRGIRGQERSRFGKSIPMTKTGEVNKMELHRRTNAVKRFLESPTSTITGSKKVYQQRAKTINERYNTNFNWQDLANYYESAFADKNDSKYGSKTEVKALGAIRRFSADPAKIQQAKDGNLKLSNDNVVNQVALEMLNNGLDPQEIFNK